MQGRMREAGQHDRSKVVSQTQSSTTEARQHDRSKAAQQRQDSTTGARQHGRGKQPLCRQNSMTKPGTMMKARQPGKVTETKGVTKIQYLGNDASQVCSKQAQYL